MAGRVMVGMSGGVDSAVSALILKQQGYDVLGVFMKNWEEEDDDGVCTAAQDYDDMRRTCDVIGIPYYTVNFAKEYRDRVFSVFLREYSAGRTPNPDVLCNTEIKFNAFLEFAMMAECKALATGHYARVKRDENGRPMLRRGADDNKDQSYFLCGLTQDMLDVAMFPVGGMHKHHVREMARIAKLPVAEKKDSTGICFIGERSFRKFISKYIPTKPGYMVNIDTGERVGEHEGLFLYTIGQRKGLGIGGKGTGDPWFVVEKDVKDNILYICQGEKNPRLFQNGLTTAGFHWISGEAPREEFDCTAKFRYRQKDVDVHVKVTDGGIEVKFKEPQRAVTPGQYAVLYQGQICLGGGIIENPLV
ncbi:MAG: tRNA 2-thiouridine(34) synthase MnmA [Clostridiales bacterium]|nr:tRNA 2-thiouridine(34) synthase MnmA [Clostridiales bacterium]